MAQREEFEVTIGPDGHLRLDFRGMNEESYRRIVEVLKETIGPVEPIGIVAEEGEPPGVHEYHDEKKPTHLEAGRLKKEG